MRVKEARCPECGADVRFSQAASALCVCSYCRSVIARTDVDVEKIGKVALLAEIPSVLRLGARGTGYGGFTVAGRLQLDYGAGTWNEWYLSLDNGQEEGRWLWLAEAQGRLFLTAPSGSAPSAPPHDELHLGHTVDVPSPDGATLTMHVVEVHEARIVSAEGELPFRVDPGEPVRYADLSGPRRSFGTLDYGAGNGQAVAYVGRQVELAELGMVSGGYDNPPAKQPSVKAARMECPSCHGALELRAPDHTLRVTCPYCASLVDVSQEPLKALTTVKKDPEIAPRFPLGAKGTLRGAEYVVIGHLRRRIEQSGFAWDEYVLAVGPGARGGFHYLVESGGHLTLTRPVHYGDLQGSNAFGYTYQGRSFRHAETCRAQVVHVSGEFPWEVEVGEEAKVRDYWADGAALSVEESEGAHAELNASLGEYLDRREALRAFGLKDGPPFITYIAPHQTNPHRQRLDRRKRVLWPALAALAVLMMVFSIRAGGSRTTQRFDFETVAGVEPAAEHIFLSEPFTLGRGGSAAVSVELEAPSLQDGWVDTDLALINDEDGVARQVGLGASYYSGVDDGESWSEGSRSASVLLPSVPSGRYVLRVEPSWPSVRECTFSADCGTFGSCEAGHCRRPCGAAASYAACLNNEQCVSDRCVLRPVRYSVTVRHGASRAGWGVLFGLLMLFFPLWSWIRSSQFEQRRREDMTE